MIPISQHSIIPTYNFFLRGFEDESKRNLVKCLLSQSVASTVRLMPVHITTFYYGWKVSKQGNTFIDNSSIRPATCHHMCVESDIYDIAYYDIVDCWDVLGNNRHGRHH